MVRDLQLIHLTELVGHCLRGRDHSLITYCDPSFRVQGAKVRRLPCTNPSLTRLVRHCRQLGIGHRVGRQKAFDLGGVTLQGVGEMSVPVHTPSIGSSSRDSGG